MDSFQEKYNALIIKYNALLTENEELKSILSQHGIVYSSIKRADESAAFSSITYPPIKLSLDEKIALFRNFFKGRDDVFARRWFNKTTEKGGYQPVCINEWRRGICDKKKHKCAECPNRNFAPLTNQDIYRHLEGKDENGCDVIGLYVVTSDNKCSFLCADFDDKNCTHGYKNDVLAFISICREWRIPFSIERSRSGNGAHVWTFFNEPIPACKARVSELKQYGNEVIGVVGDVLDVASLGKLAGQVLSQWGKIDILLNIAGGNMPGATLEPEQHFYDMDIACWEKVTGLNMNGTVYPSMVFGKVMAEQKKGCIVNVSSMAAYSAITRVPGYSAAKSAVANFTQWLASEMALKYGDSIRVNAIAPGFFIGDQNRRVLINPDGSLTERSRKVLAKTPMGRFGDITELNGAVQFLCSDAASFITGALLPVDGGFSAYSGV